MDNSSRTPTPSTVSTGTSRRRFLVAVGAAGVAGLAGCGGGGDGGGDGDMEDGSDEDGTATEGSPSDLGTATVAALHPVSGAYSSLGPGGRRGAKLAVEQINNDDSYNFEIEPVYEDTATEPASAQQSAQKAVQQDGANFMLGAISSSVALGLNEFAKSEEAIYFSGGAAVPITGKACNEWVFRVETNTAQAAEAYAAYTVNNLGTNVWFHIADYAYGDSVYNRVKKRMQAANDDFAEVGKTASKLGSSNFESFLSQIGNSEADAVIIGMTGGDLINFMKQSANAGLTDQVAHVAGTMSFQLVRKAAAAAIVGQFGGLRYNVKIDPGDNNQFVEAYGNAYDGAVPDNFTRVGYDSMRLIAKGMDAAGSTDPGEVKDALEGGSFTTVLGDVTIREADHQATNPTWMSKISPPSGDSLPGVERLDRKDDNLPLASDLGCDL